MSQTGLYRKHCDSCGVRTLHSSRRGCLLCIERISRCNQSLEPDFFRRLDDRCRERQHEQLACEACAARPRVNQTILPGDVVRIGGVQLVVTRVEGDGAGYAGVRRVELERG